MEVEPITREFFKELENPEQIVAMFDLMPELYAFGKDRDGRFVFVNKALRDALEFGSSDDIIGSTDFDHFDPELAKKYREEDHLVMKTGEVLRNRIWLVPHPDGTLHWYVSSKSPLWGKGGEVIGIFGVMRDFSGAGLALGPYKRLSPVISYVQEHFSEAIEINRLAVIAGVSVSTLERSFKKLFQLSPLQYLTRVRLNASKRALIETDASMSNIAIECGFYDQSHFTKKFRSFYGVTPTRFRKDAERAKDGVNGL